jgi:hypothetical protein
VQQLLLLLLLLLCLLSARFLVVSCFCNACDIESAV